MDIQGCSALDEVRSALGECTRCGLHATRTNIVFGVGSQTARVMLIGEAPGRNEDIKGEPFVGAAGRLLDELLDRVGLTRAEVYIANVLKCRPPGNRDPEPVEVEACTPFLREQIRVIGPEVLVTLGNFATRFVLRTDAPISRLRGQVRRTGRFLVLPMFHPAAAIYDRTKLEALSTDFGTLAELLHERGQPGSNGQQPEAGPAQGMLFS